MKKVIFSVFALLIATSLYADNMPTEETYQDMDQLRQKLVRMRREMDKFMKDVIANYPGSDVSGVGSFGQDVRVDISQTEKEMLIKADLPGMDKDKISVILVNNKTLTISGERQVEKKQEAPGVVRQERLIDKFERVIELPAEGSSEGIKATYKNGVLDLAIPKKIPSGEKEVKVKIQ